MTNIIGMSGKKGAGKDTSCRVIFGDALRACGLVDWIKINEKGQLVIPIDNEGIIEEGILDPLTRNPLTQKYLEANVWPMCKVYSFASPMKDFCIDVFGLSESQVYGSDDDKNKLTNINREDIPGIITKEIANKLEINNNDIDILKLPFKIYKRGKISSRELLQYFGTDLIRKICPDAWVNATINKIKREQPTLALICDVRFPNEVEGIQKSGGKIVRFTRAPFTEDKHKSETALDNFHGFDWICDNSEMNIYTQNQSVIEKMKEWKILPWNYTD